MYATPILQRTTPVAHLTTGLAIYAYPPINPCLLPQPSLADLIHRRLRRIRPHAHHRGGHPAANPHRGTLPHGPPHGPHHLRCLVPWGTGSHGRRQRRDHGPPTRQPPAHRPGLVRGGGHCRPTPTPPHIKTTTPQGHRNEPRHPSTATLEIPSQPPPLRPTSHPPPPASRSLLGEGGRPLGSGGAEGCSSGSQAGGRERGGGVGGPPPRPPAPSGVGVQSVVSGVPPRGILMLWGLPGSRGRRARSVQPPTGQCGGGGGKGGGTPTPWFTPPSSPGRPLKGPLRLRRPGRRRSAVGRQRAGRAGACLGRGAPAPGVQRPLRGGCGAAVSSVCLRLLLGLRGREGGEWGGASGPLAPPPDGRGGGGMAVPAPGASHRLGGRTLPPTPST